MFHYFLVFLFQTLVTVVVCLIYDKFQKRGKKIVSCPICKSELRCPKYLSGKWEHTCPHATLTTDV